MEAETCGLEWHGRFLLCPHCCHRTAAHRTVAGPAALLKPQTIETVWLKAGPFLGDRSEPSIADLLLSCEVDQLCLLDGADQVRGGEAAMPAGTDCL